VGWMFYFCHLDPVLLVNGAVSIFCCLADLLSSSSVSCWRFGILIVAGFVYFSFELHWFLSHVFQGSVVW
jgi:hypothetical protein